MRRWLNKLRKAFNGHADRRSLPRRLAVETLEDRCLLSADFLQTNLVSDIQGMAQIFDKTLVNPWGLVASAGSPWWLSDNGSGLSAIYNAQGQTQLPPVTIPGPNSSGPNFQAAPTGIVFSGGLGFSVTAHGKKSTAAFIFATEDGTISAFSFGVGDLSNAILEVDNSVKPTVAAGAVYKGLAIGADLHGDNLIYATNFRSGHVDVFDQNFHAFALPGNFSDPKIPNGFAPFNIQNIGGNFYVTYAKQNSFKHDDVAGIGNGFVDVFNGDGVLQQRLISHGLLDSPWGITMAPAGFGDFGGDLLVGNFGNGQINAFDPHNGHFLGTLQNATGRTLVINGLWALQFGNGKAAGPTNTLFFTAGIDDETHGLFGSLQAVPHLHNGAALLPNLSAGAMQSFNTVPPNGDVNPYGVAFVPQDFRSPGALSPGDVLVSNFNNKANQQGTGTTIVRISPTGEHSVFFQGQPGMGLTTALGVLKSGFVLVGSVPTTDGTSDTIGTGSLTILDANGKVVKTLINSDLLDSPWDLAVNDKGNTAQVFVANVLSGTVTRIDLKIPAHGKPIVESETLIGSGYQTGFDPNALVVGPTGLAYDVRSDTLYVASTLDNQIFAIARAGKRHSDAGTGEVIFADPAHLHGPLGLILAPNGDLITANGDAVNADAKQSSELVEFTPDGQFVGQFQVDTPPGSAFGLAAATFGKELRFAAVNDNTNTLDVWTFES